MIVITGQLFADAETLPQLYGRLKAVVEPTRAEEGCLFYHMAMEDEDQGIILVAEGWRDQAALDAHLAMPAINNLLTDFAGRYGNDLQVSTVSVMERFGL